MDESWPDGYKSVPPVVAVEEECTTFSFRFKDDGPLLCHPFGTDRCHIFNSKPEFRITSGCRMEIEKPAANGRKETLEMSSVRVHTLNARHCSTLSLQ